MEQTGSYTRSVSGALMAIFQAVSMRWHRAFKNFLLELLYQTFSLTVHLTAEIFDSLLLRHFTRFKIPVLQHDLRCNKPPKTASSLGCWWSKKYGDRTRGKQRGDRKKKEPAGTEFRELTAVTVTLSTLCGCVTPFYSNSKTWWYSRFKCEILELLTRLMLKNSISSGLTNGQEEKGDRKGRKREKGWEDTEAAEHNTVSNLHMACYCCTSHSKTHISNLL